MPATWTSLGARSVRSTQAKTESAPSGATDGMSLADVYAISFWLDAGVGQTISGDVGQVDIYVLEDGGWGVAPNLVLAVPPGSSGNRRVQLGTVSIEARRGRLAPIANGVTASGATVVLDALATVDAHSEHRSA